MKTKTKVVIAFAVGVLCAPLWPLALAMAIMFHPIVVMTAPAVIAISYT